MMERKVALVTGASSGIGAAIARSLSKSGYALLLTGRNSARLYDVAQECREFSPTVDFTTELEQPKGVEQLVEMAVNTFGGLDLLVNNAGLFVERPLGEASYQEFAQSLTVNYLSAVELTRQTLPLLKSSAAQGRQPTIVNIGSVASGRGYARGSLYAPTKAALRSFSESLRLELHDSGIGVVLIEPGVVNTKMHLGSSRYQPELMLQPSDVAAAVIYAVSCSATCCPELIKLQPRTNPQVRKEKGAVR